MKTWVLVFALMAVSPTGLPAGAITEMPSSITERSLVSDPEISRLDFRWERGKWQLFFDARFFNDCLADSGVAVVYSDLGAAIDDGHGGIRLFHVRQLTNPAGCPDIYMPVTRQFRAKTSSPEGIRRVVVMNCFSAGSQVESRFQVCTLAVDGKRRRDDTAAPRLPVAAILRPKADLLPVLSNIRIVASPGTVGRRFGFTLGFDVSFPSDCHAEKGIEIEMLESPLGVSDKTGNPVVQWLAVVNMDIAHCPKKAEKGPIRRRYEVPLSVRSDYPRKLAVINQTAPRLDPSSLFFALDVLGGAPSK